MTPRFPRRGGNWNNSSNAGRFALNLNNTRSNTNTNIGSRAASCEGQKARGYACASSTPHKGSLIPGQEPKHAGGSARTVGNDNRAPPQ